MCIRDSCIVCERIIFISLNLTANSNSMQEASDNPVPSRFCISVSRKTPLPTLSPSKALHDKTSSVPFKQLVPSFYSSPLTRLKQRYLPKDKLNKLYDLEELAMYPAKPLNCNAVEREKQRLKCIRIRNPKQKTNEDCSSFGVQIRRFKTVMRSAKRNNPASAQSVYKKKLFLDLQPRAYIEAENKEDSTDDTDNQRNYLRYYSHKQH
eukprot:TRINITY_DN2044_c0_g3_i1.p1 TRINITY_DN2044_c0_g3~~TRINITY_DN2044_c0_g3_i1.p1  ORF type:complete len:208 (+),score=32.14 TRINITY_DN2044_c0_g3_i1:74-697(+)